MADQVHPLKIGRRGLARMLAATAAGATASSVSAQGPAQAAAQPDPFLRQAREGLLDDARRIALVPLPRTTEPAYRFKA